MNFSKYFNLDIASRNISVNSWAYDSSNGQLSINIEMHSLVQVSTANLTLSFDPSLAQIKKKNI